jgi:hypothetical protein
VIEQDLLHRQFLAHGCAARGYHRPPRGGGAVRGTEIIKGG